MLAKSPELRPRDAATLAGEIAQLGDLGQDHPPPMLETTTAVTQGPAFASEEQELLCVVLAATPSHFFAAPQTPLPGSPSSKPRAELQQALRALGARAEWLLDGALIATLHGQGSAADQAARAARAALLIKARWPAALITLATGCATVHGNLPVGEAVDRGTRLLRLLAERRGVATAQAESGIWLDELSAGLLARCFTLTSQHGLWLLSGEEAADGHLLLGKPTPCLGREQELGLLDLSLASCIEESTAEVALITAPTGVGKSRLGREFLRRTALRDPPVTVMHGRSDMLSSGSPYAILRDALRRHCELGRESTAQTPEAQRERLHARLTASIPLGEKLRVAAFLGELCGVPFGDDELPILRAARSDPKIMSDQLAETLLDLFRAECGRAPLVLVLEDFQWADVLTVKLLAIALRELSELPLFVIALARPEVHEVFPKLWSGLRLRETQLNGLSKKACERLCHQALGRSVASETVARIIDQAAGNPLFLEELIRVVATGDEQHLPATVLAMLQARIGQLDNGARRVIRAASVFGQTFWLGGLRAVLHRDGVTQDLDSALRRLVDAELVESRLDSRLPGETEYSFRHALCRDAAYSLLTEEDRRLGHHRAGEFLEQCGEADALVLAEHFAQAKESARAAQHYLRAGLQSFERNDLEGALGRADRGAACAPTGQTLGELQTLRAMAHCWRSELQLAFTHSTAALPLLRRGSRAECRVLFHGLWAALVTGHEAEFVDFVTRLADSQPDADANRDLVLWASLGASLLTSYGRRQLASQLLNRAQQVAGALGPLEPDLHGAILVGRSDYVRAFEADPWSPLQLSQQATAAFAQIGDRRDQITAMNRLGQAQSELGDFAAGEQTLREAAALARRIRVPFAVLQTELHLAALLANVAAPALQTEAAHLAANALGTTGISAGYKGWCLGILAGVSLRQQQPAVAVEQARESLALCERVPLRRLWVLTLLTRGLIRTGQVAEAVCCAQDLLDALAVLGSAGYVEVGARLAAAEGFGAAGDSQRAHAELQLARRQLDLRIAQIPEPAWRQHYASAIEENARLLATPLAPGWQI